MNLTRCMGQPTSEEEPILAPPVDSARPPGIVPSSALPCSIPWAPCSPHQHAGLAHTPSLMPCSTVHPGSRDWVWQSQAFPFRAWARMSDPVIWDWNLCSTDASECVCCPAAELLPSVCTRQQNKSPVSKDNQVTNNWKITHSCSLLKPHSLQADVLIVDNHEEKSFKYAESKVRGFFPSTEMSWNYFLV